MSVDRDWWISESDTWDPDFCMSLCSRAGLFDLWLNADADALEDIIFRAAQLLGVVLP